MKRIIFAFFILFSLNSFSQTKEKPIYIEIRDSSNVYFEKTKDSITFYYDIYIKNIRTPYLLTNIKGVNESFIIISNKEYLKLKKQVLTRAFLFNLTQDEILDIVEQKTVFILDLSNPKKIKKILVEYIPSIVE